MKGFQKGGRLNISASASWDYKQGNITNNKQMSTIPSVRGLKSPQGSS